MKQKTIIFDFDGTLVDTFSLIVDIYNDKISKIFRSKKMDEGDILNLRKTHYKDILKSNKIGSLKLVLMLVVGKIIMNRNWKDIEIFDIEPALKEFKKQGFRLGIYTSNSTSIVKKVLQSKQLDHYFDFISSSKLSLSKSKGLKKLLNKKTVDIKESWYVGDETRDVLGCNANNLKIISVTWGFNDREILEQYEPAIILDTPIQLTTVDLSSNL